MEDNTVIRAPFGPRAAAFVIDRLLLAAVLLLVRIPLWIAGLVTGGGGTGILFRFTAADILCWLLMSVYFILLTHFTGATLGKRLMGLRVEKADGSRLSLLDVIYRETIGRYLSGILCIGYIMALADKQRRALHDYICDSRVVYDEAVLAPRRKAPDPGTPPVHGYTVPGEIAPEEIVSEEVAPEEIVPEEIVPEAPAEPV